MSSEYMKRKKLLAKKQGKEIKKAVMSQAGNLLGELERKNMETDAYYRGIKESGSEGEINFLRQIKETSPKSALKLPKGIGGIIKDAAQAKEEYVLPDSVRLLVKRMASKNKGKGKGKGK